MNRARLGKSLALAGLLLATMGCAALWLCFQYIPGWYQPIYLSHAEVESVRSQAEQTFEAVTQKMIAGELFSITLSARQLNEMLSAQQVLWPAAADWLDPRLTTPCVAISRDHLMIGMRFHQGQTRSILSARIRPELLGGYVSLTLEDVRAGRLPVPLEVVSSRIFPAPTLTGSALGAQARPESNSSGVGKIVQALLKDGGRTRLEDELVWPNGEIRFRIVSLSLAENCVTLSVQPLD